MYTTINLGLVGITAKHIFLLLQTKDFARQQTAVKVCLAWGSACFRAATPKTFNENMLVVQTECVEEDE